MPRNELASLTKAQLIALITSAAEPREESAASQHFRNRDLPCPEAGNQCKRKDGTVRMFRTEAGVADHLANFPNGKSHDSSAK
jgi:hypothetical protein